MRQSSISVSLWFSLGVLWPLSFTESQAVFRAGAIVLVLLSQATSENFEHLPVTVFS
jgi:hypothetical protein